MSINVPCCPILEDHQCCDRLDIKYRLPHRTIVEVPGATRTVIVDVTIQTRIERCPGALALGEIVYNTTLLPGEKVRLFSTDRRSRFTYDKETKTSYRHAQASEDNFYMSSIARELSDLSISEAGSSSRHAWGDWGADMDSSYGTVIFAGSAGGSIEGHYDDQSTRGFMSSLSSHAKSAHYRSEAATRTTSSISVGEVTTRTHAEGESEDHFESASRIFSNPNRCHAITFYFYRINRMQMVRFTLVAIDRTVRDPAAPTIAESRPPSPPTGVSVLPTSVLGTSADRLETEERAAQSVATKMALATGGVALGGAAVAGAVALKGAVVSPQFQLADPIPQAVRELALKQVDEQLIKAGLLTAIGGSVSDEAVKKFSWELEFCLPTPGVIVKGCLDDCDICEETLHSEIMLDLEHKKLENDLLKKQIELLEKSQEYRCCPDGHEEVAEEENP